MKKFVVQIYSKALKQPLVYSLESKEESEKEIPLLLQGKVIENGNEKYYLNPSEIMFIRISEMQIQEKTLEEVEDGDKRCSVES